MRDFIPVVILTVSVFSIAQTTAPSTNSLKKTGGPGLLLGPATATAPSSRPATTQPASTQDSALSTQNSSPLDPKWTDLLTRLASDDFKAREAAQKELAALRPSERPFLLRLAAQAEDPEVKASLTTRAQEMEIDEVLDPPPISITLKNADVGDVAAALSKITGVQIDTWNPHDSKRCTVDLKDVPFWEAFAEISRQMPMGVQFFNDTLHIQPQQPGLNRPMRIKGFAVFPTLISRTSNIDLQSDRGPIEPQLNFSWCFAADPRTRIASSSRPMLLSVKDDNDNLLLERNPEQLKQEGMWNSQNFWNGNTDVLKIPDNLGTKIVSAKGAIRLLLALETKTVDAEDMQKNFKKPITVGNYTIKFTQFDLKDQNINFSFSCDQPTRLFHGNQPQNQTPMKVAFIDANDKQIWSTNLSGGGGCGGGCGTGNAIATPVKFRVTVPTRTKEVMLEFEMKDLPLPPK